MNDYLKERFGVESRRCPLLAACVEIILTMKDRVNPAIYDLDLIEPPQSSSYYYRRKSDKEPYKLILKHTDGIVDIVRDLVEIHEEGSVIVIFDSLRGASSRIEFACPDSLDQFTAWIDQYTIFYMSELIRRANAIDRPHYAKMWEETIETYKKL